MNTHYSTLRLILGDQLNAKHSWFTDKNQDVLYVVAELFDEATYTRHHIQKVCGFFLAMENFANALKKAGHQVLHLTLDDTASTNSVSELLKQLCKQYSIKQVEYQRPDEYRLFEQLSDLKIHKVDIHCIDSEHFLLPFNEIDRHFTQGKHQKMEFFYRKMRKRFDVLMEDGEPSGGRWNYDSDNRCKLKPADIDNLPEPLMFSSSVKDVIARIKRHSIDTIGEVENTIAWPVNRKQSLALLSFFCEHCLAQFGRFQDAMTDQTEYKWSLYHSRLSFALNTKMLHPLEVINAAIAHYEEHHNEIDIAQVEGFVRQILGWREFIRGIYWSQMPDYASLNQLQATRNLPDYFWNADTRMNCLSQAISQSIQYAYAHHIQRLMITGNFCLLAGIDPDEVDQWYLGIYIDAVEWVEMPNTRGMSQFADGGIVATKPYSASGNYVNKMSDYCKNCFYSVKEKTSKTACPLNSLYWQFIDNHRSRFEKNPRMSMVYRSWDKMAKEDRTAILKRAKFCLDNIDQL